MTVHSMTTLCRIGRKTLWSLPRSSFQCLEQVRLLSDNSTRSRRRRKPSDFSFPQHRPRKVPIDFDDEPPVEMIRLNKAMSRKGLCSRREADAYLEKGWISLEGRILTTNDILIDASKIDQLELTGAASQDQRNRSTILLHKPYGIVSSQPESDNIPAVQLLTAENQFIPRSKQHTHGLQNLNQYHPRFQKGWAVAGRLDKYSTGLLVLTQSGKIVRDIIQPNSEVEKEYLVNYAKNTKDIEDKVEWLQGGVEHEGEWLEAVSVDLLDKGLIRIVLTAGRKHHIRRMFQTVGCPVEGLKRVRIGNVVLGSLPPGQWRYLGKNESFTEEMD